MNAANYPFHPVTEEEKELIAKSTRKHLICKNKQTGELYEINPLEMEDWKKHHREYYDLNIEGTNWVDQGSTLYPQWQDKHPDSVGFFFDDIEYRPKRILKKQPLLVEEFERLKSAKEMMKEPQ